MAFKIFGMLMIMASSVLTGLYFAAKDGFRSADLVQMKKALNILKAEIDYAITPLPQAMENIANKVEGPVGGIFRNFHDEEFNISKLSASQNWDKALENVKRSLYFENEDYETFKSFGKTLGYLDRDMQIRNIDMTISYINEKLVNLGETGAKNKKLYSSMGVLGGLFVCVMLV